MGRRRRRKKAGGWLRLKVKEENGERQKQKWEEGWVDELEIDGEERRKAGEEEEEENEGGGRGK